MPSLSMILSLQPPELKIERSKFLWTRLAEKVKKVLSYLAVPLEAYIRKTTNAECFIRVCNIQKSLLSSITVSFSISHTFTHYTMKFLSQGPGMGYNSRV